MKKIAFGVKCCILIVSFLVIFTIPALAYSNGEERIYGADRYKTALAIAEKVNNGQVDCVVLAPGNNYSNALPASVLAYKNNAPLLLVNYTAKGTFEAFDYIEAHLSLTGKIYLVGDKNYIGDDFALKLKDMGYNNIITISGADIYKTDCLIAKELNVPNNSPFVISSGVNFPDALSISSAASLNGWPILLTDGSVLTDDIKILITEKQPNTVYITGGTSAIAASVENQIKSIIPNVTIKRFSGSDRYETSTLIANEFFTSSTNIYMASGLNYPDALAGSVLAAKNSSPIILVNPETKRSVPYYVVKYLVDFRKAHENRNLIALGGTIVVPDDIYTVANDLVGNMDPISLGQPVEFDYNFVKDPLLLPSEYNVDGNGNLTEEEEQALVIAVRYYLEADSVNVDLLKDDNHTFGHEYCCNGFAKSLLNHLNDNKKNLIDSGYFHKIKKMTLTNYGINISYKKSQMLYFRIIAEVEMNKDGKYYREFKEYCTIYLEKDNGYWEVWTDSSRPY